MIHVPLITSCDGEPLNSFTIAIGAVIGIVVINAVNVTMVLLCLYYHKTWKPKHQRAPVSGRVAFDGHRGGDESYVMIDLHNVKPLEYVHSCMCIVQNNMLGNSSHPVVKNAFWKSVQLLLSLWFIVLYVLGFCSYTDFNCPSTIVYKI